MRESSPGAEAEDQDWWRQLAQQSWQRRNGIGLGVAGGQSRFRVEATRDDATGWTDERVGLSGGSDRRAMDW